MYDVRWHAASAGADRALDRHAAAIGAREVTSGRLCPRCGSSEHGRPWLRTDGVARHASVSRAGDHLVTAIADRPVGVDVESVADVARGWDPALVLAEDETAEGDEVARTWARKEAVLKMRGTGLSTPMTEVVLADEQWADIDAPPGHVAAISWAGAAGPSS